jgi:hypothetical protein
VVAGINARRIKRVRVGRGAYESFNLGDCHE